MKHHDQTSRPSAEPFSPPGMTRRGFVTATLAAGFAFAVRPVSAATITTDETGLTTGEIRIRTADGHIPAYRAKPKKGSAFPVVLVVQEIFGVHEHIKDICRRLAKLGYVAIAPELYARQGDVLKMTDIDEIRTVVSKVPDAQVLADLDATVAWIKESGEGNVEQLAITAFVGEDVSSGCMRRIIRRSRRVWPGTGASSGRRARFNRHIRSMWPRRSKSRSWDSTGQRIKAFHSTRSNR